MNFKQGDIVTYPDTNLFFQVYEYPSDQTLYCKMFHDRKSYPIMLDTVGLIKTSVH